MTSERPALLVVGQSVRILAEAAHRAGYAPIAVDWFADLDTAAVSLHAERYEGGWTCGFQRRLLLPAIDRAISAAGREPVGAVLGSGFEDRPRLAASIADRLPVFGSHPERIPAVKDPAQFAAACAALGIPHPEISRTVPADGDWLLRRRGGTGGTHIRPAVPGPVPAGHVAQRQVTGEPIAAAVLSTGSESRVLAWTAQWASPTADAPYRFAGVAGPVRPPAAFAAAMEAAAVGIVAAFSLVGLVSVDCLAGPDGWWMLEVNPRPGASVDVLDGPGRRLLGAHIAACGGRFEPVAIDDATIRGTEVVYAEVDSGPVRVADWPDWVSDRPPHGSEVRTGAPIATVSDWGADLGAVRAALATRGDELRRLIGEKVDG